MGKVLDRLAGQGSLTLHLSMRDGTFNDLSPTKSNGTPNAGTVIVKSENGMSCNFNGSTGIITTGKAMSNFITAGAASFMIWAKPRGIAPVVGATYNGEPMLVDGNTKWIGLYRANVGGSDRIWFFNWDGSEDTVGIPYNAGQMICVCGVHSGGNIYIYSNGNFVASTASGNTAALTQLLLMGGIGASFYSGWLDTAIVCNIGLSASEVSSLYGETHPRGVP